MKNILCIFLLSMFISIGFCQVKYLKPSQLNSEKGILKDYYIGLFPLLFKDFSDKPIARYALLPSFSSEYAFSIEEKDNHFFIISNYLSTSYWNAKDKSKVQVKHTSIEINKDFYNKIREVFNIALKQARQPNELSGGFDGETSYLSTMIDDVVKTAETWSPNQTSHMGQLVEICKGLYLIGLNKIVSQDEVSAKINHLISEIK